MSEYIEERLVKMYRVRCTANWAPSPRGCSGAGPWGQSACDALDAAEDQGWYCGSRCGICPAHLETQNEGAPP
jgi:hypothetical protein